MSPTDAPVASLLMTHARRLRMLVNGYTSHLTFPSFKIVLSNAVAPGQIAEVMSLPVEPAPAEHFLPNRKGDVPEAFEGGTVGTLMRFLEKKRFSLEPWCPVHLSLLKALDRISAAAHQQVKAYREHMEAIRKGTLDLWNPPKAKPVELPASHE